MLDFLVEHVLLSMSIQIIGYLGRHSSNRQQATDTKQKDERPPLLKRYDPDYLLALYSFSRLQLNRPLSPVPEHGVMDKGQTNRDRHPDQGYFAVRGISHATFSSSLAASCPKVEVFLQEIDIPPQVAITGIRPFHSTRLIDIGSASAKRQGSPRKNLSVLGPREWIIDLDGI